MLMYEQQIHNIAKTIEFITGGSVRASGTDIRQVFEGGDDHWSFEDGDDH